MQNKILIYNTSGKPYTKLINELIRLTSLELTYIESKQEFETLVSRLSYQIVFVIGEDKLDNSTIRFIKKQKNKSFKNKMNLFVLFAKYNTNHIKQALLTGAKQVYILPINALVIATDLINVHKQDVTETTQQFIKVIKSIDVVVNNFGRCLHIDSNDKSKLIIESNIKLSKNDQVLLNTKLFTQNETNKIKILKSSKKDLQFKYDYSQTIRINSDIMDLSKEDLTQKRIKIIWASTTNCYEIGRYFDKDKYSINIVQDNISFAELDKIDAKIIFTDKSLPILHNKITKWLEDNSQSNNMAFSNIQDALKPWIIIKSFDKKNIVKIILNYFNKVMLERVAAESRTLLTIHRNSPYSRCSINTNAKLVANSNNLFVMESSYEIAINAIIKVTARQTNTSPAFSTYMRVKETSQSNSVYKLVLGVIPKSSDDRYSVKLNEDDIDLKVAKDQPPSKVINSFFDKKTLKLILALAILGFAFYIILQIAPKNRYTKFQNKETLPKIQQMTKSIRDAFK